MLEDVKVSVFSRVKDSPHLYNWYRAGNEMERRAGHHIVVDAILNEHQLNKRLNQDYG